MSIDPAPFRIHDPLPAGTTLLEASAGTGKTWTIGALVARYVGEGVARLEEMLVVTFGRAASQELRERVRAQLVEAEAALADPAAYDGDNAVVRLLLDVGELGDAELDVRHGRLVEALAGFDGATIATTHQFCSMVLDSLGVAGDTDAGARLVEDLDDLVDEVVDDLYLRKFAPGAGPPAFTRKVAVGIARAVVGDPRARLLPEGEDPASGPGVRFAFAQAVREEMERRKRRLGILSYDDLLSRLADALERDDSPARSRMRQRWRIVLVDEFQDTDPVQWEVLDRAFSGHATMVLIGDPKQAIYAFRGGDVFAYLDAARTAVSRRTLDTNWRSDAPLVEALDRLLGGAALGDADIVVRPVAARTPHGRLAGAPSSAPVRLRVLPRSQLRATGSSPLTVKRVRPRIADDLAHDVRALLDAGPTWDGQELKASDVAVIAYRHADLAEAKAALSRVGVRAVIAGGGSVFATPAAVDWLALLEGLEQPQRAPRVRAAALTAFLGLSATELDAGGDDLTDELADRLRSWGELVARHGVAAVYEAAGAAGLPGRVLSRVDGERQLTDLRHLAETLHEVALTERLGLVALLAWLRREVADARAGGRVGERTRRLDSDESAVQLVTIHASKGLEYPVVYLPALADRWVPKQTEIPRFHDAQGRRSRHVGSGGAGWTEAGDREREEEAGEWLRLLYVAMTRAKSQVVAWWSPNSNAPASPLHRILLGRGPGEAAVPPTYAVPTDEQAAQLIRRWAEVGALVIEPIGAPAPTAPPRSEPEPALARRTFTRTVDVEWRRTSYSSLSSAERSAAGVTSEPEEEPTQDETLLPADSSSPHAPGSRDPVPSPVLSPMAGLPVGATFGSLVHAVLEHTDPAAPDRGGDLRAELRHHVVEELVRWPVALDVDELTDALVQVCGSPLGPLADDITLRDLPRSDRLVEMDFELPLDGGDEADRVGGTPLLLGRIAGLLREHLPEDDPVRAYATRLDSEALGGQVLRGYLTGSIDVALRVGGRYLVVDYKTNWLGRPPTPEEQAAGTRPPLAAHDYRPDALVEAMGHSDYPLQALLYAMVLHRFLRWRQPAYDPDTHLGGVLYLYLRGMCGPDTPRYDGHPTGVFSWRPPSALVVALSDLMDGAVP